MKVQRMHKFEEQVSIHERSSSFVVRRRLELSMSIQNMT